MQQGTAGGPKSKGRCAAGGANAAAARGPENPWCAAVFPTGLRVTLQLCETGTSAFPLRGRPDRFLRELQISLVD